jgi:HK97 family phage portal protein
MGWYSKITKAFSGDSQKSETVTGGFELLQRLTGETEWSDSKALNTYEKSLYVFACVSKIAEKVSGIDWSLYQIKNSLGDTQEITSHPALDLLYKVNPFQTKAEFLQITIINKKLTGDAFWYKVRNNRGDVIELWNLRPDLMEIVKDPEEFIKAYQLKKSDGSKETFDPADIVHIKAPSPLNDYFGTSPIQSAQTRIDTEDYASRFQRDFFINNARPDAVLKTDALVTPEQREEIRADWQKKHRGVGKTSKVALLEGGLDYQQISVSQREMDYIESMRFTRDDILVAFSVPKAIVAITDDVNRANAETAMRIFLSETIKPEMDSLNEKVNEMLIIPDFGENLFLNYQDPTPENRDIIIKEYESGIKNNYLLINEVRARENLPPVEGGWDFYMPMNSQPVGGLSKSDRKSIERKYKAHASAKQKAFADKVFKGRSELKEKFVAIETLAKQIKRDVKKGAGKKAEKYQSVLIGDELREKYATLINKAIDRRSDIFKANFIGEMQKQHARLMAVLGTDVEKSIGKETKTNIQTFYKDEAEQSAEFVFPYVQEYAEKAGNEALSIVDPDEVFEMTPGLDKNLKKYAKDFGIQINKTTRDKIIKAIEVGLSEGEGITEIGDRIEGVYDELETWRADMIARTMSTSANNEGTLSAYKQSEVVTGKEWIATMDSRTREEHLALDGEIVGVNEQFSNGLLSPEEPNCRCVIAPAVQ